MVPKAMIISFLIYQISIKYRGNIRADKPPNGSIIIPGTVIVKPGGVKPLAGE
jgi:hypothetical protein